MAKKKSIFDFINAITNKTPIEYDKKIASGYMIAMWLSHDRQLVFDVNEINEVLFTMKDEAVFRYFYDKIPKKKRFIKWVKKEKVSEEDKKEIEQLMEKYELSEMEAKRCLLK